MINPPTIPFDFVELGNRLARSLEFQHLPDDAELVRNLVDALDAIHANNGKRVILSTEDDCQTLTVMIEE